MKRHAAIARSCVGWIGLFLAVYGGTGMMSVAYGVNGDAAYVRRDGDGIVLGNGVIERRMSVAGARLRTVAWVNRTIEEALEVQGAEFRLVLGGRVLTADDFHIRSAEIEPQRNRFVADLTGEGLELTVAFQAHDKANYLTKELRIRNTSGGPLQFDEIWVESLEAQVSQSNIRSTGISPVAAFLRCGAGGYFLCLDFPCMQLEAADGRVAAGYSPHETLAAGGEYTSHCSVLGAYRLSGAQELAKVQSPGSALELKPGQLVWTPGSGGAGGEGQDSAVDLAESDAWRRCIDRLYPPACPTALLMTGRMCEGNMEELQERWGGNDVLYQNEYLDNIRRDVALYGQLGFNVAMFGPAPPAWTPDNPDRGRLKEVIDYARSLGIRLGLYTNSNRGQTLGEFWSAWGLDVRFPWDVPGAEIRDKDGKTVDSPLMCWGSPDFQQAYRAAYLPPVQLGFGEISHDFTFLQPCFAENHGHVPGDLYHQVKGLMDFMAECHRIDPQFLDLGFLGWGNFIPHGGRYMDMFYVADPWMDLPLPGLNQNVLLGDSRRRQMRRFVLDGLPPRLLANMDFFSFHDSVVPDYMVYPYVVMQGLALTANWSFGPQLFRDMQQKEYDTACRFIRFWNDWRKERWEILNNIRMLSPAPGIGVLEAYMHADSQRGYLFLVNPNPFSLSRRFVAGESMGLPPGKAFWVHEWYPENKWRLMDWRPVLREGDAFTLDTPAFSVLLLEFVATDAEPGPAVWGVPDATGDMPGSFQFERRTSITRDIGLKLPEGAAGAAVKVDGRAVPTSIRDGVVMLRETPPANFQGERPNPELRNWAVRCESLEQGMAGRYFEGIPGETVRFPLPSIVNCPAPSKLLENPGELTYDGGQVGKFLGGYVYNTQVRGFRGKMRYAHVTMEAGAANTAGELALAEEAKPTPGPAPGFAPCSEYWAATHLTLPLTNNTLGEDAPPVAEHLYVLLPFVDYHRIDVLRAWINGEEAAVDSMGYYRSAPGQPFFTHPRKYNYAYYVDGTKWGLRNFQDNTIVLYVKWK